MSKPISQSQCHVVIFRYISRELRTEIECVIRDIDCVIFRQRIDGGITIIHRDSFFDITPKVSAINAQRESLERLPSNT